MLSHQWISIVVPLGMVFANPVTYRVELVTFTCGMEFCILTIIKNAIIFIVADI